MIPLENMTREELLALKSQLTQELNQHKAITEDMDIDGLLRYYLVTIMGFKVVNLGYAYTVEGVKMWMDSLVPMSMTKGLYPSIANKYNTTSSRVERAIRHAIETCTENDNNWQRTVDIFGPQAKGDKVENGNFIACLADYVKNYHHEIVDPVKSEEQTASLGK